VGRERTREPSPRYARQALTPSGRTASDVASRLSLDQPALRISKVGFTRIYSDKPPTGRAVVPRRPSQNPINSSFLVRFCRTAWNHPHPRLPIRFDLVGFGWIQPDFPILHSELRTPQLTGPSGSAGFPVKRNYPQLSAIIRK
jgi:hypothetical protein